MIGIKIEVIFVGYYIDVEDIEVTHEFIKKHITFVLSDDTVYEEFYDSFQKFFLRKVLSSQAFESLMDFLNGHPISNKQYIINSLRRIFRNDEHFKGIIGEHLFAFYIEKKIPDFLWAHGPKGRSSAEPGIDFITFTGNSDDKKSIDMTIWETKTTENTVSSRATEIYDFFSENGSFDENIDSEITSVQQLFVCHPECELKEYVAELYDVIINREFKIGAIGISPRFVSTNDTFKKFAECFKVDLSKEQRIVNLVFVELLMKILSDLRDNVWNRLQA
ncbi:hypothetical protein D3C74_184910 [compost metagenome]